MQGFVSYLTQPPQDSGDPPEQTLPDGNPDMDPWLLLPSLLLTSQTHLPGAVLPAKEQDEVFIPLMAAQAQPSLQNLC